MSKKKKHPKGAPSERGAASNRQTKGKKRKPLDNDAYSEEMTRLQVELVKLEEWVRHKGLRVVVLFEGRDAAV